MCLGCNTNRSRNSVSSPNADAASRRALTSAAGSSAASCTTRMPLPPPPADGLTRTGKPTSAAPAMRSSSVSPGREMPGTTGTPKADTAALAAILSPIVSMAATGGPMKTMPGAFSAAANSAFSERNP